MKKIGLGLTFYILLTSGLVVATLNAVEQLRIPSQSFIFTQGSITGMGALIIFIVWTVITVNWAVGKSSYLKNVYLRHILVLAIVVFLAYFYLQVLAGFVLK